MMTVINNKAIIAACTEFGARIGAQLDSREGDAFDIALKACLAALASKPLTKKASASGPSASKLEKIAKKQAEIKQLGGTVDNTVTALKELNATIKELKAIKKAEEKAAKDAAKAEEKAKKAEEKAAKKAAKAASKSPSFPKDEWRTAMFPNEKLGKMPEWAGKNGSRLRIAIHKENGSVKKKVPDNWSDKASAKFAEMFPEGKFVAKKKIKKKIVKKKAQAATLADEQAALIAKLVAEPTGNESKNGTEDPEEATKIAKAKADAEAKAAEEAKAAAEAKAAEEAKEIAELEAKSAKLEKELAEVTAKAAEAAADVELEEEEELEEIEVEEPEFPGEEEVEEFSHESLEKWEDIDFYKDEDDNVWDENMEFVGTYDDDDNTISFKEDYEPEE